MIRLLGSLCVFCACGYAGLKIGSVYEKRTKLFRLLQHGLTFLETEINYSATPLPLALKKVGGFLQEEGGIVFRRAAEILQSGKEVTAYEAWAEGVSELTRVVPLHPEEVNVLRVFGLGLGNSDKEEQLKNLALTRRQLQMAEETAEESRTKHQRMWQYLGFCLGAAIVIVLI